MAESTDEIGSSGDGSNRYSKMIEKLYICSDFFPGFFLSTDMNIPGYGLKLGDNYSRTPI